VVRELLLQEASLRGIQPSPEADEQGRRETGEEALLRALLDQAFEPSRPTTDECRRFYDSRRDRFRTPDLFEASHILIEPADKSAQAWAVAEQQAEAIASEVGDDPQAFAIAAREFSKCPTAHQDGSLGQILRGEIAPGLQATL